MIVIYIRKNLSVYVPIIWFYTVIFNLYCALLYILLCIFVLNYYYTLCFYMRFPYSLGKHATCFSFPTGCGCNVVKYLYILFVN